MNPRHAQAAVACFCLAASASPLLAQQPEGPTIQLTNFNGGEVLDAGATYRITWTGTASQDENPWVEVYLYRDGQYYAVASWARFWDGGTDWTICPTTEAGGNYTIHLRTQGYPPWAPSEDESNGPFAIHSSLHPAITVLRPEQGEVLPAGRSFTAQWTSTDVPRGEVDIDLYQAGQYVRYLGSAWSDAGHLTVALPDCLQTGSHYQVALDWRACRPNLTSFSQPFTIENLVTPEPFRIVSPNGGEIWHAGEPQIVTWTGPRLDWANIPHCEIVTADHSNNIPVCWTFISPQSIALYPCPSSSQDGAACLLRLTVSNCGTDMTDESDAAFSIATEARHPTLKLIEPSGGETLHPEDPVMVRWTSTDLTGDVYARLYRDGQFYSEIGAGPAVYGQLIGTLCPNAQDGSDYTLVLSGGEDCTTLSDTSGILTIARIAPEPTLSVTSPSPGEVWTSGTTHRLTWQSAGLTGNVTIELRRGSEYLAYIGEVPVEAGEVTTGVCSGYPGDNHWFHFIIGQCEPKREFRSGRFTLLPDERPRPTLTLTSLNSGEAIPAGSRQLITWTSTDVLGDVSARLLLGSGYLLEIGKAPVSSGQLEWNVCPTGIESEDYVIQILSDDKRWGQIDDTSAVPFTITDAMAVSTLALTSPTFGPVITAGHTERITWTTTHPSGMVMVTLWRDGHQVMVLGEAPMAQGYFDWDVCPWLATENLSPLSGLLAYGIRLDASPCTQVDWMTVSAFTIQSSGAPMADLDHDCDVDADDLALLERCLTGPAVRYDLQQLPSGCAHDWSRGPRLEADLDQDGDVDQDDFGVVQRALTGSSMVHPVQARAIL